MKSNFTFLFLLLISQITFAQTLDATLVELNFHSNSDPQNLTPFKTGFFFSATDGDFKNFGRELWLSNGTKEGTFMVKDIKLGQGSSNPSSLVVINDILYFTANDGFHGSELWKSDGTENGTQLVKDIKQNDQNDYNGPLNLINFNGKLFFTATNNIDGFELWTTDGTEAGTYMVKDINVGASGSSPSDLFVFKNNLYFVANNGNNQTQLWKSDGTDGGTNLVKDINPNSSDLSYGNQFLILNDNFYFFANDGINGFELWKSNGTESGTIMVKNIRTGGYFSNSETTLKGNVINNQIVFQFDDGTHGTELWITDGTELGTRILKDINSTGKSVSNTSYVKFKNEIYFVADDGVHGNELWKTNGTSDGTVLLKDINENPGYWPNTGNASAQISKVFVNNDKLFFYSDSTNSTKRTLWVSDGTTLGTLELSNEIETLNSVFYVNVSNSVIFTGLNEKYGNELWITDGTSFGTSLFADLNHLNSSNASRFTDVNGSLFFRAGGTEYGNQLYKSDGTISGTKSVKDINPGYSCIDDLSDLKVINGTLFFSAIDSTHGYELWKSDGTESGTVMVKDINVGNKSSMRNYNDKQPFSVIKNELYFYANDGVHGFELWKSNGTESGTFMVKDLTLGSGSSYPSNFVVLNNTIYFSAINPVSGMSLWKTDGTELGTTEIMKLPDLRVLNAVNNKLILFANSSGTTYGPHDLWVSNGTVEGTNHIKSFGDNIDSEIQFTTILNNELYFVAKNPDSSRKAVYKTNGTLEGTVLLFDGATHPTMPDLDINTILTCGNYVYFLVSNYSKVDKELWRTNGVTTEKVAGSDTEDFLYIRNLTCYKNNLLYLAESNPNKIWLVNDASKEAKSLNINVVNSKNIDDNITIEELGATKNKLYFRARNKVSGNELYITNYFGLNPPVAVMDQINVSQGGTATTLSDGGTSLLYNDKDLDNDVLTAIVVTNPINGKLTLNSNGSFTYVHNNSETISDSFTYKVNDGGSDSNIVKVDIVIQPFLLPYNNFLIETKSETCLGKNNGEISIVAAQKYNYVAQINSNTYNFENNSLVISNLEPGIYPLCITVEGKSFNQCYTVTIGKGGTMNGKSTVNLSKIDVEITEGTAPFMIFINDISQFETTDSHFSVQVKKGDVLKVQSAKSCEGVYSKEIFDMPEAVYAFPNPTKGLVEVTVPTEKQTIFVELYAVNANLISKDFYPVVNKTIQLGLDDYAVGVYIAKVYLDIPISLMIIKK